MFIYQNKFFLKLLEDINFINIQYITRQWSLSFYEYVILVVSLERTRFKFSRLTNNKEIFQLYNEEYIHEIERLKSNIYNYIFFSTVLYIISIDISWIRFVHSIIPSISPSSECVSFQVISSPESVSSSDQCFFHRHFITELVLPQDCRKADTYRFTKSKCILYHQPYCETAENPVPTGHRLTR